jgi:hypothetical protein
MNHATPVPRFHGRVICEGRGAGELPIGASLGPHR